MGIVKGSADSAIEFVPNLIASVNGLGQGIWAFAVDPIQVSEDVINGVYNCIGFLRSKDGLETLGILVPEVKDLIDNWIKLNDKEKGEKAGYIIGKYGVEIFAGGTAVKGIKAFRDLKRANNLLNFESMTLSQRNKALLISKVIETRKSVLNNANLKIKAQKQGNHIPGHRYFEGGKSELMHQDPQKLVDKFAGTGQKITNEAPGMPGYRERIDFGEVIGIYKSVDGKIAKETTVGMIIYSKEGTHIVPLKPKK